MTRIERLKKWGFDPIHLFGKFYWVKYYSHKPFRIIVRIEDEIIDIDNTPSVPSGDFR